ncbi:hypothetical protein GPECTOR_9g550 [Gonium pectorale]|uniref:Uncharacterized protein n=1 Tax=Gonium pectorale TaxID=33097 RepID=A0A150GRL1_GONPE|nr:hypothetical protein GPECTOR_9g550 [Gonium pectorale]|eukprot:KXZ52506.1 hypothetical protein GPECTOR_9g550 [Gonium pectorale]
MSILGLSFQEVQPIVLCAQDFPDGYSEGRHPDDYVKMNTAIQPQFILHNQRGRFSRLWWRVSWKLQDGTFVPMSFLLDTSAPKHIYLSEDALNLLEADKQVVHNDDMGAQHVTLFTKKCAVEAMPHTQNPANILGLKMLRRFGLELYNDEPGFQFKTNIPFLTPELL